MKKKIVTWVIMPIVCLLSAAVFISCNIELKDMDGTEYYDTTEKEFCKEYIDEFFEEMLKNPDFVVTCANKDGEQQYTETVKGTDAYTLGSDGSEAYAFKKGKFFYVATISRNSNGEEQRVYYCSDSTKTGYYEGAEADAMETMYKNNHCSFMNDTVGVGIVKGLSEEGATFNCKKNIERVNGFATSSLDFTYASADRMVTITASAEEERVKTLRIIIIDDAEGGHGSDLTWTFTYGGASVTIPDVDAWDK